MRENRLPRGFKNRNPGNVERNQIKWKGADPDQSGDIRFVVFSEMRWGVRAIVRILRSYHRQGLTTVKAMISKYAPSVENNTDGYIARVAAEIGVGPDDPVDPNDPSVAFVLTKAIIEVECGPNGPHDGHWVDDDTIAEGVQLADD